MNPSLEARLRDCLLEHFPIGSGAEMPQIDESLSDAGIVDSAGILTLIMILEEEFDISVEDADVHPSNLDSIAKLADFIRRKRATAEELS